MQTPTTILEVAGEGGSILVHARRGLRGAWEYRVSTNEAALIDLLGEDASPASSPGDEPEAPWLSWAGALEALDRYPWPMLTPTLLDPDFAAPVLHALEHHSLGGPRVLARWRQRINRASRETPSLHTVLAGLNRFTGASSETDRAGAFQAAVRILSPGAGRDILGLEDWLLLAPPARGEDHWKAGRSAMEAARAWCGSGTPAAPNDLLLLFGTSDATRGVRFATVIPERRTRLDDFGPGRQHDLVAYGMADDRRVVVSVEAKADESFGSTIGAQLDRARRAKQRALSAGRRPSRVEDRIDGLIRLVFGRPLDVDLHALRYQLLHGVAGAVLECGTSDGDIAAFVVHEFVSARTVPAMIERNERDLASFVCALNGGTPLELVSGKLVGPFHLGGAEDRLRQVPLWIGKVTSQVPGSR